MTKIWKNTLSSIAVLVGVSFVSVVLVLTLNILLPPKTSFFDEKKLQSIAPANSYYELTESDLIALGIDLEAFNATFQGASVRSVFRAEGGENDGNYIIESEGLGYQNVHLVIMYIAYNSAGEILGLTELSVQGNSYWGELVPLLPDIYSSLIGKHGNVGSAGDLVETKTGATQSLNGIARAVNIANAFITNLVGEREKLPFEVEEGTLLTRLRDTSGNDATFICYPYESTEMIGSHQVNVLAAYFGDGGELIFETQSDVGDFGSARLLVLVSTDDTVDYTVVAVNPISLGASDYNTIVSEFLNDREILTEIFGGLNAEQIAGLSKWLQGSTGATETTDGLKVAVTAALISIDPFMEYLADYQSLEEEAPND